ncbi:unnamed protein product [Urochloa humidicola]
MDAGVQAAPEPVVRKGPWTKEEDRILVNYIAAHHAGAWNNVARAAGLNRTGKSCRLRWLNHLCPGLRRGSMTAEEQKLIVELQDKWGNKWSRIAKQLPGRTDNEVKNFWRTKIQHKHKRSNNKQDGHGAIGNVVTLADICCGSMDAGGWNNILAVTEDQGSSNYSAKLTGVTQDYGIVTQQQPSIASGADHLAGYQVLGGGAGGAGATATDQLVPDFLDASGANFWAIDDFWTVMQSYSYKGSS